MIESQTRVYILGNLEIENCILMAFLERFFCRFFLVIGKRAFLVCIAQWWGFYACSHGHKWCYFFCFLLVLKEFLLYFIFLKEGVRADIDKG